MANKPILVLDFDGVCSTYAYGWLGADIIPDPAVSGLWQFIEAAHVLFNVCVHSARSRQEGGLAAMQNWFLDRGVEYFRNAYSTIHNGDLAVEYISPHADYCPVVSFPFDKPAAFLTIDDRAITFDGTFPPPEALINFKPWNKK